MRRIDFVLKRIIEWETSDIQPGCMGHRFYPSQKHRCPEDMGMEKGL
ncbi:MAG: hypothetical protein RIG66_26515 [Coleofasciculus sp. E2-BRE-01]